MSRRLNRRDFLGRVAAVGVGAALPLRSGAALARSTSPNERLNIGIIGTSHRGAANVDGVKGENIVALCDIDDRLLGAVSERFPKAKKYNDFRKLLDQADVDAVVISTADHTHAPAAAGALRSGKHVYCEKPLTHTVAEARVLENLAAETKLATQMGTQIHATDNYRRVVELIRAGAIGPVREVHVWCGKDWSGGDRPSETPPVPDYLHWDLWLGPAPERPYHPTYLPATWRRWWDFGNGTLGDMGCHLIDLAFWALELKHPTTVEAQGPPVHPETAPAWLIVDYQFPARGGRPPVTLSWYDGDKRPEFLKSIPRLNWNMGVLFVGDKGMLAADYGRHHLLPEEAFRDYTAPEPTIPPSIGHHAEWIAACKTGSPTTCHFGYSGPLTETVLLGNVAYRSGRKLTWNAETLDAGSPEAAAFLKREYRSGWSL